MSKDKVDKKLVNEVIAACGNETAFPIYRLVTESNRDETLIELQLISAIFTYTSVNPTLGMIKVTGVAAVKESDWNIWTHFKVYSGEREVNQSFKTDLDVSLSYPCIKEDSSDAASLKKAKETICKLEAENEKLRMQLAACGVVAMANTAASAVEARKMHADYWSASLADVCRAVDAEIKYRDAFKSIEQAVQRVKDNRLIEDPSVE